MSPNSILFKELDKPNAIKIGELKRFVNSLPDDFDRLPVHVIQAGHDPTSVTRILLDETGLNIIKRGSA